MKITYEFSCKNAFGLWTDDPEKIKDRRCLWNCNCNGKGIKTKFRHIKDEIPNPLVQNSIS